eukprot:12699338-Heterocapsa_arctica.AAC.1
MAEGVTASPCFQRTSALEEKWCKGSSSAGSTGLPVWERARPLLCQASPKGLLLWRPGGLQ